MVESEGTMFDVRRRQARRPMICTSRHAKKWRSPKRTCVISKSYPRAISNLQSPALKRINTATISSHVDRIIHTLHLLGDASQELIAAAGIGLACTTLRPVTLECASTDTGLDAPMQCLLPFDDFGRWHQSLACLTSGSDPDGPWELLQRRNDGLLKFQTDPARTRSPPRTMRSCPIRCPSS